MRFLLMHRTDAFYEAGNLPSRELVDRVGKLIGEMAAAKVLHGGEGLRPSSEGVRLRFAAGKRTVTKGPFKGENELPAGFTIVRVASLEDATEWASRYAAIVGDVEIDIRPLTEAWDIGIAPKPENLATRRFMLVHKADAASEAGKGLPPEKLAAVRRLRGEMKHAGVLVTAEELEPSSRAVRVRSSGGKQTVIDGPFVETKELIGGYVILEASSLQDAMRWVPRYAEVVKCAELDLRPLQEPASVN